MLVKMAHAELGEISTLGNPMRLSANPATYRLPPPALGEHNIEILTDLGYSTDDIAAIVRGS
jgi:crotonobetainyl-CoA:carnitine CoA-transferase CaiB-like acyl-CoA transferase